MKKECMCLMFLHQLKLFLMILKLLQTLREHGSNKDRILFREYVAEFSLLGIRVLKIKVEDGVHLQ